MQDKYLEEAKALLGQRGRILETLTTKTRLQGLERRLFGLFGAALEYQPDLSFDDPETRLITLCLAALTCHQEGTVQDLAEALQNANVHEWPEDFLNAVDILGYALWQPVIHGLIEDEDTPATLRTALLAGFPSESNKREVMDGLSWQNLPPGQVEYCIRQNIACEAWWSEAKADWANPERQQDLFWLTLGLYRHHTEDAKAQITQWLAANPSSPQALMLAAISSDPEFSSQLQDAILAEHVSPWLLAVQGRQESLAFCHHLLENPRFNKTAAQAWTGLTGQKLPLAAKLTVVGQPIHSKAKQVDAGPAGEWLQNHTAQETPILAGQPATAERRLNWLQGHFGEDTRPIFYQLWLERPDIQRLRPMENHFQRLRSLRPDTRP